MNKLKTLTAACLGAAASTSVMAFEPQDFGTSLLIGHQDFNVHSLLNYNNVVCGALCVQFSTESGHNWTHFRIPDGVPGASETLTCDQVDASGNILAGTVGNTPETVFSYSFNDDFGSTPGNDVTSDGVNGPAVFPAFGNTLVHESCELTTNELSKVVDGWTKNFAPLTSSPGVFLHTFYDFAERKFSVLNCAGGFTPTITQARAIDALAVNGGDRSTIPFEGTDPGACDVSSVFDINYLTCDTRRECGQFGKSVPVPAFAAAALGLGLLGVTYLTSARRRVKAS